MGKNVGLYLYMSPISHMKHWIFKRVPYNLISFLTNLTLGIPETPFQKHCSVENCIYRRFKVLSPQTLASALAFLKN